MSRSGLWLGVWLLCGILLRSQPAGAAPASGPHSSDVSRRAQRMLEPWVGSDASFIAVRKDMDFAMATGRKAAALARVYGVEARRHPTDALAQYRWAYVALRAARKIPPSQGPERDVPGVERALAQARSPRSYQYDRLWFISANFLGPDSSTRPLAERLLRRKPRDYEVMFYMIKLLDSGHDGVEKQRALDYAGQLIRKLPKRPSSYAALGFIYAASWERSRSRMDAQQAFDAYSRAMQLAPANHWTRPRTQRYLDYLQRWLQAHEK